MLSRGLNVAGISDLALTTGKREWNHHTVLKDRASELHLIQTLKMTENNTIFRVWQAEFESRVDPFYAKIHSLKCDFQSKFHSFTVKCEKWWKNSTFIYIFLHVFILSWICCDEENIFSHFNANSCVTKWHPVGKVSLQMKKKKVLGNSLSLCGGRVEDGWVMWVSLRV